MNARGIKTVFALAGFLIWLVFSNPLVQAGEVDELKQELQELKSDYESKIHQLQVQIDALSEKQEKTTTQIEEKIDKKLLDVEYVGRYEGPFKKGGLLIKNPSGFGNVTVGGYADLEFFKFEDGHSAFDQHRWIINIGAELAERLRFYSEYEIEHGGTDASGTGESKVEQAWMDFLIKDWINLRAGALLIPFGRYNLYHDSDLQDLTARPLVARDVIPTTWTESGAGFYGEVNPKIGSYEDLSVGYEVYVINGLDDGFSDTGLGGARGSLKSDNNNSKAVVGRLVTSPFLGHEVGLSGYWGKYNNFDDNITGAAVDWLSSWGPLELVGEYAFFDVDQPATGTDVTDSLRGYYIQANYHFWPKFLDNTFLSKNFSDPTFTLIGRYGFAKIEDDGDAKTGDNKERRYTLGLNYRPVDSCAFKVEYQWNETKNETLEQGDKDGVMASVAIGF